MPLPQATVDACRAADAALLGAVGGPQWDDNPAEQRPELGLLQIRSALNLFCNLRPVVMHPALQRFSPLKPERLVDVDLVNLQGRAHFFGIAARCMRQVLVDHARARSAGKRGGDRARATLRRWFAASGYHEMVTSSFLAAGDNEKLDLAEGDVRNGTLSVINPHHGGDTQLRTSLLPELLHVARRNLNAGGKAVSNSRRVTPKGGALGSGGGGFRILSTHSSASAQPSRRIRREPKPQPPRCPRSRGR